MSATKLAAQGIRLSERSLQQGESTVCSTLGKKECKETTRALSNLGSLAADYATSSSDENNVNNMEQKGFLPGFFWANVFSRLARKHLDQLTSEAGLVMKIIIKVPLRSYGTKGFLSCQDFVC